MGNLHEGHLSLIRKARTLAGENGLVLVTIFVNKTQFGPREDFKKYPRTLKEDLAHCRQLGVDIVFAPDDEAMYGGDHSTFVSEERLAKRMEGASRPTHFRGVTTVVAKLFNLTPECCAVDGRLGCANQALGQAEGLNKHRGLGAFGRLEVAVA